MRGMSFEDLPHDWPTRPLSDATVAPDVVDLVVRDGDREGGCLGILLCGRDHRLLQPVTITDLDGEPHVVHRDPVDTLLGHLSGQIGGVVVAVGRPRGLHPDDEARTWHEAVIASCRDHDVPLLGTYLATVHGVVEMPVWQEPDTLAG